MAVHHRSEDADAAGPAHIRHGRQDQQWTGKQAARRCARQDVGSDNSCTQGKGPHLFGAIAHALNEREIPTALGAVGTQPALADCWSVLRGSVVSRTAKVVARAVFCSWNRFSPRLVGGVTPGPGKRSSESEFDSGVRSSHGRRGSGSDCRRASILTHASELRA